MPATLLEHYNVYCKDLKKTVDFYEKYVGLRDGERPPFPFPGAWMYAGEQAVLHLVSDSGRSDHGSGAIDHIALRCTDLRSTLDLLKKDSVPYMLRKVPARPLQQVFVHDPDGIQIEMNFWDEELVEGVSEHRDASAPVFQAAPATA
ncbi:VOC family protein [Vineibacter terrae]|uniref:VOC family protein n=1 Tax=Vineibacter terrae TaxID=2586908 RepID=UPI002E37F65A|nr:VOC family protein [Vineibacter terrae]HEX2885086.1 VOC family protein [Vineibacter terrae]